MASEEQTQLTQPLNPQDQEFSSAIEQDLTLEWNNVSIYAPKPTQKQILFNQSGSIKSGTLMAIIGASGSGKTTLLNSISGYANTKFSMEGKISLGGVENLSYGDLRSICGYVLQEDILHPQLTVKETIEYSAKFRGFKLKSKQENDKVFDSKISSRGNELNQRVVEIIDALELQKCADTNIGDGMVRGVSGGERKRTAIAAEMVTDPKILILDEPTTGLDSLNAENVVKALRQMADDNKIVVTTIHQPSVDVLKMFDKILILHEGKKVYIGSFEGIRPFFKERKIEIPMFSNPVEFLLNVLNLNENSCQILQEQVSKEFINIYNKEMIQNMENIISANQKEEFLSKMENNSHLVKQMVQEGKSRKLSNFKAFTTLYEKEQKIFFRNKEGLRVRISMAFSQSIFAAILYWQMNYDERGIQNRKGVLYYVMMYSAMMTMQIAAFTFGNQTALLRKSFLQKQYKPLPYFFARTLCTVAPNIFTTLIACNIISLVSNMNNHDFQHYIRYNLLIVCGLLASEGIGLVLSSLFQDPEKTIALVPIFVTPLSLFAGLLVDIGSIPKILSPFKYISFFRFMYEGMILNEFDNIDDCKGDLDICNVPENEMSFFGGNSRIWDCILILGILAGSTRLIAATAFWNAWRTVGK